MDWTWCSSAMMESRSRTRTTRKEETKRGRRKRGANARATRKTHVYIRRDVGYMAPALPYDCNQWKQNTVRLFNGHIDRTADQQKTNRTRWKSIWILMKEKYYSRYVTEKLIESCVYAFISMAFIATPRITVIKLSSAFDIRCSARMSNWIIHISICGWNLLRVTAVCPLF